LSKPGNKNEAGETPWLALNPPQPATRKGNAKTMQVAGRRTFQFNLTNPQYKLRYGTCNT